jgi:hypothetical protein
VSDTGGFEAEALDVWRAAGGDENRVGRQRVILVHDGHDELFAGFRRLATHEPGIQEHANTLALELLEQDGGRLGLILGDQPAGALHDRDFAPQTLKGLRQFAADRPAADDGHSPRQLGEREDSFIGEKARGSETGNINAGRASAGGDDRPLEAQRRLADDDRLRPGEARITQKHINAEPLEPRCRIVIADSRPQPPHASHDRGKVNDWLLLTPVPCLLTPDSQLA